MEEGGEGRDEADLCPWLGKSSSVNPGTAKLNQPRYTTWSRAI